MPVRTIAALGATWRVYPSGYVTQYDEDEYGLFFVKGEGDTREVRVTRYSPPRSRARAQSFTELSDDKLREYLQQSQPSFTSPEAGYRR
jgi:hypothetical protein